MAVITVTSMKPKFLPVLEMCIENGLTYGYRRAFKHNDNPTEEHITMAIREAIMFELYEWFDFEPPSLKDGYRFENGQPFVDKGQG